MALFVTVLFTAPNLEIFFILTIFRFGLCDIRNNEGLGKCYLPGPQARFRRRSTDVPNLTRMNYVRQKRGV